MPIDKVHDTHASTALHTWTRDEEARPESPIVVPNSVWLRLYFDIMRRGQAGLQYTH